MACPEFAYGRGHYDRSRGRPAGQGWWRRCDGDRAGGVEGPIRQGAGTDPEGLRGRDRGRRRPGRPAGLDKGYYVKPTVFANVTNDMTIAREEIFGPVLCILGYGDLDQAVEIANDTEYGLAGYVSGADLEKAREVARKIRAGMGDDQPCVRPERAVRRLQAQRQRSGVE